MFGDSTAIFQSCIWKPGTKFEGTEREKSVGAWQ